MFLRSAMAAGGSQVGRAAIRLVTDLTLARLIVPEGHGLFALAWSIVIVAGLVRDQGLPYEVVRDPGRRFGSVLLWELFSGVTVTLVLMLGAGWLSGVDPDLPRVLRVLALWVLLEGLSVVPRVWFERELRVDAVVVPEIGRGALMAATAITLAALGFGVWSLVIGELVASAAYAAALWVRAWGRMQLDLDPASIPELLRSSYLLFLIALLANAPPLIARFLVEGFEGTAMVGQFEKAHLWAMRAQMLIVPALARAVYPTFVTYRLDRDRLIGAYHLGTLAICSAEILAAYLIFWNAEFLVLEVLMGSQWQDAVPLIRILSLLPLVDPISRLGGEMLKTVREDRTFLAIIAINVTCLAAFGWWLGRRMGAEGVAWAHFLALGHGIMAWRIYRIRGPSLFRLVRDLSVAYLLPLPLLGIVAWVYPSGSWERLAASAVVLLVVGGVVAMRFYRPFRTFFFGTTETPGS